MKRKLIITKYSVKHQVFNKRIPSLSDVRIKALCNALRTHNYKDIVVGGMPFKKFYLKDKHYRALTWETIENNEEVNVLVLYRVKSDRLARNIANTKEFQEQISPIFRQVISDLNKDEYTSYQV